MDDVSLVYNTNGKWMRSGNPGTATLNPISWIGNLVSREAICYNVGYIKFSNGWGFTYDYNEDIKFKFTSAHEIGHEILKSYDITAYSYGHKGSVHVITQSMKDNSSSYSTSGEIDIMPYYPNDPPLALYDKYAAAEKDVLGLIWLSKIKILSMLLVFILINSCKNNNSKKINREIVDYYNGIVVDQNHIPIEGVKVMLHGEKIDNQINGNLEILTTITNKKGYFAIKDSTIESQHILRVQSESRKLIFAKKGYLIDTVSTKTSSSNYKPSFDAFDGLYFIFKIPDTMTLRKVQLSK
ncbi:hypothetical protein [Frigoriflavimonas asaccharolytica]|uniref:Carboxypeptidase family protein n=1 Tax=Frigoriflavimonas asaccharolytica TaxID=2735899 RepID=A0A8J8G9E5_9FLAO|nr:hypothetical protein [Frigoriflavimonas asaccharolytica]NRS93746.1 hypothetical protein [Frigoriflavimonas asaccharolytica]